MAIKLGFVAAGLSCCDKPSNDARWLLGPLIKAPLAMLDAAFAIACCHCCAAAISGTAEGGDVTSGAAVALSLGVSTVSPPLLLPVLAVLAPFDAALGYGD